MIRMLARTHTHTHTHIRMKLEPVLQLFRALFKLSFAVLPSYYATYVHSLCINFQFISLIFTPLLPITTACRDSAVGIATVYCLDGPGIEFQFGAKFSAPVLTGPGAHPTSYTMGAESFPVIK